MILEIKRSHVMKKNSTNLRSKKTERRISTLGKTSPLEIAKLATNPAKPFNEVVELIEKWHKARFMDQYQRMFILLKRIHSMNLNIELRTKYDLEIFIEEMQE